MARIPDEVITRLKSEISIQRLAEAQGIILKKHSQDLIGLCPFHDDNEPSLVITPDKNLWHCLGACQTGGSVIDWVMKAEGISFRHAVELLQSDYHPSLVAKSVKRSTVQKLDTPLPTNAEDQKLLNRVIDYYHDTLKQNPDALAYLEKRGIQDPDAINTFKLGLSNRSLGYRLPKTSRKEGAAIRGQLQKIGIYRESGHEHFNGSLVIPVIDEHGNVQEVYGRKLIDRLRKGTPKHCYLPGPHQGIFNQRAIQTSKEIILCESLIDALSFWCAGYKNVTASYGIEGFTEAHLSAFKHYNTERILIAYDRDEAGNAAAEKLSKQLIKVGIDCYRINFPKGMDANEYAVQVTPASKSLGVVIRSAEWMGAGDKPLNKNNDDKTIITPSSLVDDTAQSKPVLSSTRIPAAPKDNIEAEIKDNEINLVFGDRHYRVRGLNKNQSDEIIKISLKVNQGEAWHLDTLDICQLKARNSYIKQASIELGITEDIIKNDIGKILLKLETLQDAKQQTLTPTLDSATLSDKERDKAIELLQSPDLIQRIVNDFNCCGVVGENTNTLVGYLAAVSRKLANPLAVIIQSTSAAGKSSLMDAVLKFIPKEDKSQYSAMTGQSLFYMGESDLKHKILAIAEEEGASQASYALKLLQSEGELTIASTSKDPDTGDLVTKPYHVEGPVMIFLTTTASDIDAELLNRCLVLTVNENREQTQAIHARQRSKRTLAGLREKKQATQRLKQHQNAQRLLKPLLVVNPYAEHLTFLNEQTRTRRDHEKYLTLIDTIALLHQYQRPIKTDTLDGEVTEYIEVTINDIEIANTLAHEVLGRTLDELPPQTRKLLTELKTMVNADCQRLAIKQTDYHFTRREIRERLHWTYDQVRVHLDRLIQMEYILVHRGGRGQSFVYELLYDGDDQNSQPHLNGLIDIEQLKTITTTHSLGGKKTDNGESLGSHWGEDGVTLGESQTSHKASTDKALNKIAANLTETPYIQGNNSDASYTPSLAAAGK